MIEHFRRHFAYFLPPEFGIPNQPVSSAKINSYLYKAIIHWQAEPVPLNTAFIAKCNSKYFTQSNTCIFNGVVFVDMQIAPGLNFKIDIAMACNLIQHMIEKMNAGRYFCCAFTIKVELDINISFFSSAAMFGNAFA